MHWISSILVASLSCTVTWALHESDVGVIDWHTKLVGIPLYGDQNTAPVFHDDLILTATSGNVLAALNATDGSIVWRSIYDNNDRISAFKIHDRAVSSLSGPGGSIFRTYDISTGHLLLEHRLHNPAIARATELQSMEIVTSPSATALFTLTNGDTVTHIDTEAGQILWTWNSSDNEFLVTYTHVLPTSAAIYAIGLARTKTARTLHITTLSPTDGSLIASVNIPANLVNGRSDFALLNARANPNSSLDVNAPLWPCLSWLESSSLRFAVLSPNLKGQVRIIPGINYTHIQDIGLTDVGQFMAFTEGGVAHLMRYDGGSLPPSDIATAYKTSSQARTESFFTGSYDKDGGPRIARVFWSRANSQAIQQTFTPRITEDRGFVTGYAFPFKTEGYGIIRHVAFDGHSADSQNNTRLFVTTSTGALQLWEKYDLRWSRDEALSTIQLATFVSLNPPGVTSAPTITSDVAGDQVQIILKQLRQLSDRILQHFYPAKLPLIPTDTSGSRSTTSLQGDAFGFHQVIVAATTEGVLYGLDSRNGEILWRRLFGLGWASERVGGRIVPVKMYVLPARTTAASDEGADERGKERAVIVTQRLANNGLVDTVVFEVDPLTGEDARPREDENQQSNTIAKTGLLEGKDVIQGPTVEVFLLPESNGTLALLDEFMQVQLYPDTPAARATLERLAFALHLILPARTSSEEGLYSQLVGHRMTFNEELSDVHVAYPSWRISLSPGEAIREIIPPASTGPPASYGRVLGNRRWRIMTVEMYEGKNPDDITRSSELSSYSNATTDMATYEQAFILPYGITALAPTSTRFGVTLKDLIVASQKRGVHSIPHRLLDPRRPWGKPSQSEAEEGLITYDAILGNDGRLELSHNYEVANVRKIVTAPSRLESTSLVLALGLDLFLTRVAPSGTFDVLSENFNKAQLVLTIVGLGAAIVFIRPVVRRRRLNERWYLH
ncbi:hypothetical protein ID866_8220 [Astraeus odoratus]|nr:hypothetical protein ID866_8220 [Astraeus odoratus]